MGRDDDLTEEEKARRGMAMLGLLNLVKNVKDDEFKKQAINVAHTFKIQYDAFMQEGFSRDEAFTLTNSLISNIASGLNGGSK